MSDGTFFHMPPPPWAAEDAPADNSADAAALKPDRGWLPADVGAFLDGDVQVITPELMPRSDGICLLYRGRTHSFHGESESGKSLVIQAEAARVLESGGTVAYVDFEDSIEGVGGRLLAMGVQKDTLRARFLYIQPEDDYHATEEATAAFVALTKRPLDLVVVDGVTDSLSLFRLDGRQESDYSKWNDMLPKRLAKRTGAAVVQIDHVIKDAESRGRWAVGSQAKMNALTGAGYRIDVTRDVLGEGKRGRVEMHIVKDRPGQIRAHCGPKRADRSQHAATVVIDSTDGETIRISFEAPTSTKDDATSEETTFRPTALMARVSDALEKGHLGTAPSLSAIEKDITGKRDYIRAAVDILIEEGYIVRTAKGQGFQHRLVRPYFEKHDPKSDRFQGAKP